MKSQNSSHWYALYTRHRFEKKVDLLLREKGLESYLPLHTVRRRWSDRWKKVEEPLFSCYVFVRILLSQRIHAVQTDGVVRIVSFTGTPSPIPDEEIDSLKGVLHRSDSFEISAYLPIGQPVQVIRGPFEGVQGRLVQQRGVGRLLVSIKHIMQGISVEININDVKPLDADLN